MAGPPEAASPSRSSTPASTVSPARPRHPASRPSLLSIARRKTSSTVSPAGAKTGTSGLGEQGEAGLVPASAGPRFTRSFSTKSSLSLSEVAKDDDHLDDAVSSNDSKGKGRATSRQDVEEIDENGITAHDFALSSSREDKSRDDDSSDGHSHHSNNGEDDYTAEDEESVVQPSEQDTDPRIMLRAQLRRSESARGTSGTRLGLPRLRRESYKSQLGIHTPVDVLRDSAPEATSSTSMEQSLLPSSPSSASFKVNDILPVRPRRYFVLTSAGKPVFASRARWKSKANQDPPDPEESEESLTSLVGVIQAIISLYAVENDKIRYIDAGDLRISFLLKSPLYMVAVSDWGEPESVLRTHLDYIYLQILSITTHSQLQSIFSKRSNFDLRRLLEGTEGIMHGMVDRLQFDFESLMGSLQVLPLELGLRDECAQVLKPPSGKKPDILYALLVSHTTLITLLRPKSHSIHPSDLHILLNTLSSSASLRTPNSESWLPICLPRFNAKGFVHAFISYFGSENGDGEEEQKLESGKEGSQGEEDKLGLGVVLITTDREGFFDMKEWKDAILEKLHATSTSSSGTLSLYSRLRSQSPTATSNSLHHPTIPALRHYIYKSRPYVQITHPPFSGIYAASMDARRRLMSLYQTIHDSLHASNASSGTGGPARLVYAVNGEEAVLGITTSSYELYIAFPPLISKKVATDSAHALARWVKKNDSRLFLTSAPHF